MTRLCSGISASFFFIKIKCQEGPLLGFQYVALLNTRPREINRNLLYATLAGSSNVQIEEPVQNDMDRDAPTASTTKVVAPTTVTPSLRSSFFMSLASKASSHI